MFNPWSSNTNKSKVGNNHRPAYPGGSHNNDNTMNQSQRFNQSNRKGFTRQEHLSFYLSDPKLKPSTRKVSPNDDTTYDTIFQTKSQMALILRVHMPPSSTTSSISPCPKMSLAGVQVDHNSSHSWIDSQNRIIGYDVISSEPKWNFSGVTLAGAVDAVVTHLQLNPPHVVRIVDPTLQALQNRIRGTGKGDGGRNSNAANNYPPAPREEPLPPSQVVLMDPNSQQIHTQRLSNVELPRIPKTFPQFNNMTQFELTTLLNNPPTLQSKLEQMSIVAELEAVKESILEGNVHVATQNLDNEMDLNRIYYQVKTMQSELRDKMNTYRSLKRQLEELTKPMDKEEVLYRLKKAKRSSLDESEDMASAWLNGESSDGGSGVHDFLETFLQSRTVHHVRAAKMERIEHS